MHAIDTNVLVRLIVRDDARQVAAAEHFIQHGAWVPTLAVAEAIWVAKSVYDLAPMNQAKAIEMLLDHHALVLQDADIVGAALDLFKSRPSIGFSDCLILATARKAGHIPLATFDRNLAKVTGAQRL
jgi:predicted nucleic-acid-binding protein